MAKPPVRQLSSLILRYLLRHPDARDSVEGIAQWWLLAQRVEDEVENVKEALDLLIQEGLVEVEGAGGASPRRIYRLNLRNKKAIESFLRPKADPDSEVFG